MGGGPKLRGGAEIVEQLLAVVGIVEVVAVELLQLGRDGRVGEIDGVLSRVYR